MSRLFVGFCLVCLAVPAGAQITPARMARTPDISGDRIVFSAEGDLWLGTLTGGTAQRLTTHEGEEYGPRFSPDGKQIAFTGGYDGGRDVYVMPVEGGAPRRLTYAPSGAEMVAWKPDGSAVLFRASGAMNMRLFSVSLSGGVPEPLPMEKGAQASYAADGNRLAFVRLPLETHRWKRYRGGQANQIWLAELKAKTFKRINESPSNEQYPVWVGERLYYVSEKDGSANLWRWDPRSGRSERVTGHDAYDVKAPSSDGRRVVYQMGNSLWLFDVQSSRSEEIRMTLASDRIHARPHTVEGSVNAFSIGPTGKRLVVEGRGQLATLPVEKGEVRTVAPAPGTRSKNPVWSPDGKWIAFVSDRGGEQNLWIAPASAPGEPVQLTREKGVWLDDPVWSPDSKRIAYRDLTQALWIVEVDSLARAEVARSEFGDLRDYVFSPDGKWLAYSRPENHFVRSLYLYNVEEKKAHRLTHPPTRDHTPAFDPKGKYLYFLSERSVRSQGDAFDFQNNFDRTTRIYALTLAADAPSPLPVESDEEPDGSPEKKAEEKKPEEKKGETPAGGPPLPEVKVDLEGIEQRLLEVPVPAGRYQGLAALPGKLLYLSREDPGGSKLKLYDFTPRTEKELGSGVTAFALSADGKKMAVRTSAGLQVLDAGAAVAAGTGKVDTSAWRVQVEPELEWRQIFLEAWRSHRDVFYDPKLHGRDWDAIRLKYEALLPAVGTRSELNEIIGEMQAELNVSHEFVGGGYHRRTPPAAPGFGLLGADLAYDAAAKAYRFTRILTGDGFEAEARSPLLAPGVNVKVGDYLLAVNGTPLLASQDPHALLIGQGGKTVTLQVNDKPGTEGARTVRIRTMTSDRRARYFDWVGRNRDYVAKHGGSNLAYIHVPDMVGNGFAEFTKHFYANLDRDGILLDVRYNNGGIVSGQILERLRRVIFEYDQARYGAPVPYHRTAYLGRVVVLCNEATSSDGEYFCTGFRAMKLGQTVGTRTWGGYMAVDGIVTLDGGRVSTPVMGSFTPDGKWLPDGYGFLPDHVVEDDPNAFAEGRDPQLDRAIAVLKEEIRKAPPVWPKRLTPPSAEKAFPPVVK